MGKKCESCFLTTKNSKLLWFQYRINHYILPTKVFLKKIGAELDDVCSFCENNVESQQHLFWECDKTQHFLDQFRNELNRQQIVFEINEREFFTGNAYVSYM